MSSAVVQKIRAKARERELHLQSQTLYNAGDEAVDFLCGTIPFRIPPDGPDTDGVVKDGELKVYDIYGVDPAVLMKAKKDKAPRDVIDALPKSKLLLSALFIVEHALRKREVVGVTVLTGDQKEDAELKVEARRNWIESRKTNAEATLANYRKRTDAFSRDPRNAGLPGPAMEPHESKAQEWLDEYRLGHIGHKRFVCKFRCGYQTDDAAVMDRHLQASHPFAEDVERTDAAVAEVREQAEPLPSPAKRGRSKEARA